ncbi:methionine adenosyltransferase [Candidatus Peregrinibacteria bacterium]|nr:methionine adenosyltransferase [Candidatus Peregrinibacteria bacterium]
MSYLFTSESVTEGHPDKVCDQISDAVLDAALRGDPQSRVACECFVNEGITVGGEMTSKARLGPRRIEAIVREVLRDIGYTDRSFGIDANSCTVGIEMGQQSPDIAMGVNGTVTHEQGAGDQGMMFGYACDDTPECMPLPIQLAHRLTRRLADVRKSGLIPFLRPDGKSQVTVQYGDNGRPERVDTVVVSTQHQENIPHARICEEVRRHVIDTICGQYMDDATKVHINPTGQFVLGGPAADCGLTGRKIIVDTYGGAGRHGGGAFSGKDPSKVDRSGAYAARWIAKHMVKGGLARRCEVQVAYAIGIARPVSIHVDTFGSAMVSDRMLEEAIIEVFDLRPAAIISALDLRRPQYQQLASYGHMGREDLGVKWEETPHIAALQQTIQKKGSLLNLTRVGV